jgi:hypothetical protein
MSFSIVACSMTAVDLGIEFAPERVAHNLAVYRTIAEEISRLREIDLSERHPAVIFDPLRAYASWSSQGGAGECKAASPGGFGGESESEPRGESER